MTKKKVLSEVHPGTRIKVKTREDIWTVTDVWADGLVRLVCGVATMLCMPRYIEAIVPQDNRQLTTNTYQIYDETKQHLNVVDKAAASKQLALLLTEAQKVYTDTAQVAEFLVQHNVAVLNDMSV